MLARLISLRFILASLTALLTVHFPVRFAHAQEEKESEQEEEQGAEEEDTGKEEDQPAVTTGGRYTKETFPLSELERTLTLIQGVFEGRADLRLDLTKDETFEQWEILLSARYGISDTLEGQVGTDLILVVPDNSGREKIKTFFGAVEGAIMYDLVDWRVGAELSLDGDSTVNFFGGVPVKVRIFKDKIAIVALERVLTIHTNKVVNPGDTKKSYHKPDLTVSVGGLFQILPNLAVIVRAELEYLAFQGDPIVPVEIDLQFTPATAFDIGIELVLENLAAKSPAKPIDSRHAGIFARFRF